VAPVRPVRELVKLRDAKTMIMEYAQETDERVGRYRAEHWLGVVDQLANYLGALDPSGGEVDLADVSQAEFRGFLDWWRYTSRGRRFYEFRRDLLALRRFLTWAARRYRVGEAKIFTRLVDQRMSAYRVRPWAVAVLGAGLLVMVGGIYVLMVNAVAQGVMREALGGAVLDACLASPFQIAGGWALLAFGFALSGVYVVCHVGPRLGAEGPSA